MIVNFEERPSTFLLVDAVWRGQTTNAGFRVAPAGGCWAMLIEKKGSKGRLSLVGPMQKAQTMSYDEGVD